MIQHAFRSYLSTAASAALFLALATSALDAKAQVQATCLTQPAFVPGLSGPPKWFGTPASTIPLNPSGARPELDDPRWASAPLMPFASSLAGASPTYRILRTGNALYLSFHAPVGSAGTDIVYFGFSEGVGTTDPDSTDAYIVAVQPAPPGAGADPIPSDGLAVVYKYHQADSPQWKSIATPAWLSDVATWRSSDTGLAYAINLKISFQAVGSPPGSVAIPRSGNFHAFFGMGMGVEPDGVVEATFPVIAPTMTDFALTGLRVPRLHSQWATFQGVGTPCREGITIDTYNIQTGHPDGCSIYTGTPPQNSFKVVPQSIRGTDPPLENNAVRVQLSHSEWGALPLDASTPWKTIAGTEAGSMSSGSWLWTWATGSSPPSGELTNATIDFTCAVQGTDAYCPLLNVSTSSLLPVSVANQALLAQLHPDPRYINSGMLKFKRPSAILNMIFIGLSEAQAGASISMRGAIKHEDANVKTRTVYLKVVRRNMPAHGDARLALPLADMRRVHRFVRNPPVSPIVIPYELEPAPAGIANQGALRGAVKQSTPPGKAVTLPRPVPAAPAAQKPTQAETPKPKDDVVQNLPEVLPLEWSSGTQHELVSRVWPVYEVHAFYETGQTTVVKGKPRKLLKALMPFGYVLHHEGPFYGFSDELVADGADRVALTKMAPDVYRVSVPNEGAIRIKTTLRAEERPKSSCCDQKPPVVNVKVSPRGCYCRAPGGVAGDPRLLPLALLPIGLFFWRRRRPRKN